MQRALIVDDDEMICELFAELLKQHLDFNEIEIAKNGVEARAKCSEMKYDLIILDHFMPEMDGSSFLNLLRHEFNGINAETLVIMVTGHMPEISTDHQVIDKTLYLRKPVDFERVKKFIKMNLVQK